MINFIFKKRLHIFFLPFYIYSISFFTSCSGSDYINSIPSGSTALISMDVSKMSGCNNTALFKSMLHISDVSDCGIDLSKKIYLFESPEGNLGFCAKVSDNGDLKNMFDDMSKQGICQKTKERRGFEFTILKDAWVVGFSDKSMLVMGPVTASSQAEIQNNIAKYLKQDEDDGIKGTPIYDKLDSIESPIAMVAQAQALPEKFVAPFTLGAPKDADASQVLIAANISVANGCLKIYGETFSFNKSVNKSLKEAAKIYRPIKGKYVKSMSSDDLMGMFMNVDGKEFISLLQNNKGIQVLLTGINAAIDMDNIIKSVNGDMAIILPSYAGDNFQMSMSAQLSNTSWLSDVDYWKQSCPKGGKISDWSKDCYYYTDGTTSFYFGVSPDKQFMSGSSEQQAKASISQSTKPISDSLQKEVKGNKMVMLVNLSSVTDDKIGAFNSFLNPIFGNINSIVYILK